MARLDIVMSDTQADAVKFQAESAGQSISEFVRRRISVGTEPSPYPFSGPAHGPSFVRDLANTAGWSQGDSSTVDEAYGRLHAFERWTQDYALRFAPQTTTSASQVVQPEFRPATPIALGTDRPLAAACEQVPINSASPFTAPSAVGDNTVQPGRAEGSQPAGSDPVFSTTSSIVPIGLAGKIDLTRELVDSASPAGDVIAWQVMVEDWARQAEIRVYGAIQTAASGTITGDFVPSGAQVSLTTTPATNLLPDLKKALLRYSVLRRRKPRNVIAGRAALDNLGGLVTVEDSTGDDTALMRIFGARVNGSVNDFATGATDVRLVILGTGDVYNYESPIQQFRFDEQSGPALVTAAIWAYHAVGVARPRGVSAIRF